MVLKVIIQVMLFIILSLAWLLMDYLQPEHRIIMAPLGLALVVLSTTIPCTLDARGGAYNKQ